MSNIIFRKRNKANKEKTIFKEKRVKFSIIE